MSFPSLSHQPFERFKIHRIPIAAVFVFFFGGFQNLWRVFPSLVAHERLEAFEAYGAFADVFVAIDPAVEFALGVIEVEDLDAIDAHGRFDFLDKPGVFSAAKIIAGSEEVGGIETNREAIRGFDEIDNRGEVFEAMSQATALACGDFEAGYDIAFFDAGMNEIERGGDALQACFFA